MQVIGKTLFIVFCGINTLIAPKASACGVGGLCGSSGSSFSLNIRVGTPVSPQPVPLMAPQPISVPMPPPMMPGPDPLYMPYPSDPYLMGGHGYGSGFGMGFGGGGFVAGGGFGGGGGFVAGGGVVRGRAMGGCGHRSHGGGCRQKRCGHRRFKCCGSSRRGGAWAVRAGMGFGRGRGGFVKVKVNAGGNRVRVGVKVRA